MSDKEAGRTAKFNDPADAWDAYCAETPRGQRSPQGALAFGFHAAPSCDADLVKALETAVAHTEHMAAWITAQKAGYSFESLGEDMPDIRAALAAAKGFTSPIPPDDTGLVGGGKR